MRKVNGNKDLVTKSLNTSVKTSKQVRIDERSNHNEEQWRTFSSTNKKNIPNKQSYNEFQYNSDTREYILKCFSFKIFLHLIK